ncbi:MAG TPA: biotin--[acetyl-CoA-carboxylase] ligase [Gemmatimonadales bacterium]|nr:biotin--[acetyl-CoA-carboxylase] ligase [Gemmatimonadales bacterium]
MYLHRFEVLGSTQDEAHRLAAQGALAGTAVVAERQTAGRGSRGREWESAPGGLWLSVVARPAAGAELSSVRAGLAVADAVDALGGVPAVGLKWPNDVIVDDRKLGGVLCEARWQGDLLAWVAVGVGLNVRNRPPGDARLPAASLSEWRPELRPGDLIPGIVERLAALDDARPLLTPAELARYARRDWLRGRLLGAPVAGRGDGIDPDGALRVRRPDGTVALVHTGEPFASVELASG